MSFYESKEWVWVLVFLVALLAVAIMFKSEMGVLALVFVIAAYLIYMGIETEKQRDLRDMA